MASLPESNKISNILLTRIQFKGERNKFIINCYCMERETFDKIMQIPGWKEWREISNSRSKELYLPKDEKVSVNYGGDLKSGKTIQTATINLKDSLQTSSLFDIPEDANHCIIHYTWDEGRENHVVRFSLKEEFERITDTADQLEVTSQERKLKLSLIPISEGSAFLKDLQLNRFQFPASGVYRSEEEAEKEVVISLNPLEKMLSDDTIYSFSFVILRDEKQVDVPVTLDMTYKTVSGPVLPKDVFCAVAEFTGEKMTLGKNGGSFISEKDNRIQVHFPVGALESDTEFTFRVENVDFERRRQYLELFPNIFEPLVGFPTSLSIECNMKKPLKEKAKIFLPVIRDDTDGEVLFLHWADEKATPLTHKEDKNSSYFVEVDHFSGFTALTKSSNATLEEAMFCTGILHGKSSIAAVLTYIIPYTMPETPSLLIDIVEVYRVKAAMKELKEEGLQEIPGRSRSSDCLIDEGGYVNIEIEGNLHLDPAIRKKVMRVRFFRHRTSNRIIVPAKLKTKNQRLSTILYRTKTKNWTFRIDFNMASMKFSQNPKPRDGLQETGTKVPQVLSEKSLSILGEHLPDSTWHRIGLELDIGSDKISAIMETRMVYSSIGFRVLTQWKQNNAHQPQAELVQRLIDAFLQIQRKDIAEIVMVCRDNDKPIREAHFSSDGENKSVPQRRLANTTKPKQKAWTSSTKK